MTETGLKDPIFGDPIVEDWCPICHGANRLSIDPCKRCSGRGRVQYRRSIIYGHPTHWGRVSNEFTPL